MHLIFQTLRIMFRPLRKYADFSGRALRMEHWLWYLFSRIYVWILVIPSISIIDVALGGFGLDNCLHCRVGSLILANDISISSLRKIGGFTPGAVVMYLGLLAFVCPNLALGCRRLHDINKSGWWQLIVVGPIAVLGILFKTGMTVSMLEMLLGLSFVVLMIASIILTYWMGVKKGDATDNRFGAKPAK